MFRGDGGMSLGVSRGRGGNVSRCFGDRNTWRRSTLEYKCATWRRSALRKVREVRELSVAPGSFKESGSRLPHSTMLVNAWHWCVFRGRTVDRGKNAAGSRVYTRDGSLCRQGGGLVLESGMCFGSDRDNLFDIRGVQGVEYRVCVRESGSGVGFAIPTVSAFVSWLFSGGASSRSSLYVTPQAFRMGSE